MSTSPLFVRPFPGKFAGASLKAAYLDDPAYRAASFPGKFAGASLKES